MNFLKRFHDFVLSLFLVGMVYLFVTLVSGCGHYAISGTFNYVSDSPQKVAPSVTLKASEPAR